MKLFILFIFTTFSLLLGAQTVKFSSKDHANKDFQVYINTGLKVDTIAKGRVSMLGEGRFTVPEKYKNVPVMSVLNIENTKPIELILNSEDFYFEQMSDGKLLFKGSKENDLFHNRQSEVLSEENKATYVYAYVKMLNAIVRLSNVVQQQGKATLFDQTSAKLGVLNEVDVDKLYYSRFWFFAIDGLLRLSFGQENFAKDMIRLVDNTKTDAVLVALVGDVVTITNQYGLDEAFDVFVPYVEQTGRIEYPQGIVYEAFAMAKVIKGSEAPEIEGLSKPIKETEDKYTLLVFHQPGCENCSDQLATLTSKYSWLTENGVRVVTVSAALEEKAFEDESRDFGWGDRLCDYKGFGGANFVKYGVIGTPMIYLIDDSNIVLGRFATVSEVITYLKNS